MNAEHERWMRLAMQEAELARGTTGDNPWVGCVIVSANGVLLGRGHTLGPGEDHAEIAAAADALRSGHSVVGATLYSTLEPCSFHGRTPACARSIAERGIRRVITGMRDPNPRVDGAGARILRDAGVEVVEGVCEEEIRRQLSSWVIEHHPHDLLRRAEALPASERARTLGHEYGLDEASIVAKLRQLRASTETLMFLPGASGNKLLWKPVADGLSHPGSRRFFGWPGFGGEPADAEVRGIDDLVERVVREISTPVVLFAQSMGGLIALKVALRVPERVRALVLSVTSGGIDVRALGGADWRPEFARANPNLPSWFLDAREDLTSELGRVEAPTLLLWGDADPISPVAVGRRLAELLPQSELVVVSGGTHDLASQRATSVLPHIERHLSTLTGL